MRLLLLRFSVFSVLFFFHLEGNRKGATFILGMKAVAAVRPVHIALFSGLRW